MHPIPSTHRLICYLVTLAALPPLFLAACATGPEHTAEDAGSASAHDAEANKGVKLGFELRYLMLDANLLQSVFGELDGNPIEIEARGNENAPAEAYLLSDVETDLLVRATQANRTSTSLAAPRLTVSSGESGWIRVANQSETPEPRNANNEQDRPPFDTDRPGITFQGGGTVTKDRRHIDLAFRSLLTPKAEPEQQAASSWRTAGRARVPDQATLLLVGKPITGKIDLGDEEAGKNKAPADQKRRPAVLVKPSIRMQQARR